MIKKSTDMRVSQRQGLQKQHAVGLLLLCFAAAANAHSGDGLVGGFMSGFMHPLSGLDHLLAMVAVGIWGATLGKPLVWALPVAFPMLMVVGGVMGIAQVPLPYVEIGIATSVVVLGLSIAAAWRAPVAIAVGIVAVFGIFHGYAHGVELPETASPAAFAAGFVISTGLLHLAGIAIGLVKALPRGAQALRAGGGMIAAAGVWILAGMPGVA
ncbi:urease accessory protein [Polaromonas sp. CG_9.5]|uniref:HupE/UreJ family protein n=1 Tax=Polaromonas sp. CG_9.5 TaxID=3071705 RepID=UPI002DF9F5BA|nr:urease accessory protein [Polaromonas sp. CG_9.5]